LIETRISFRPLHWLLVIVATAAAFARIEWIAFPLVGAVAVNVFCRSLAQTQDDPEASSDWR
jgi:hypothetical protein